MATESVQADWALYWEEGIVEARARANATKLMFRKGKAPAFTNTGSYAENVQRIDFLKRSGVDLDTFFNADSFERLNLIKGAAKKKITEVLGTKFSEAELVTLSEKLGDDLQHLIRLKKLTDARWGSMTRRQILNDLRNNFDITLK